MQKRKSLLGFVFGCLSAILTAAICFRLSFTGGGGHAGIDRPFRICVGSDRFIYLWANSPMA